MRPWPLLSKEPANKPPALPPANNHSSQDQPTLRVASTPPGADSSHAVLHTSVKEAAAQTLVLHLLQDCSGALGKPLGPQLCCCCTLVPCPVDSGAVSCEFLSSGPSFPLYAQDPRRSANTSEKTICYPSLDSFSKTPTPNPTSGLTSWRGAWF